MQEVFRPAEAAAKMGIPASTLRVYSTRFAEILAEMASSPPLSPEGRPGHRLYTLRDLALLERAKSLLAKGMTYEQALAELKATASVAFGQRALPKGTGTGPSGGAVGPTEREASLAALGRLAEALEKATLAWQAATTQRDQELVHLQATLAAQEKRIEELSALVQEFSARMEQAEKHRPRGFWARIRGY